MHPPQIHCKSLTCTTPQPSVMSWQMLMRMSPSLAIWPRGDGNGPRDSTQAAGPSEMSRMLARCAGYRSGTQSSRLADREKETREIRATHRVIEAASIHCVLGQHPQEDGFLLRMS